MGDFPGHVLPGTLFFVIGLWWSIKHILKHVCRQQKRSSSLITKEFFFRAEVVEGIVITGVVLIAFIFHNHTHGRTLVDTFGHQLLSFAIFLAGLVAFIEVFTKNNVVLALLRSSLVMLHGLWFCQVAFVLFPKNRDHAWNLSDHSNVLFLTVCFCMYYALTYVIIGINYALVTWLVKWRLSKLCTSETQLLKNSEQQEDSEDEM
ncbi:Transmembrane protein 45A [Lemmus lemmus]